METTKKPSVSKKVVSLFLSFALLFNCFTYAFNAERIKLLVNYSGEQYFNAIYFKKGDLATKIYNGELTQLVGQDESLNKAEIAEIQSLILKKVATENPKFFADFKKGIESNDLTVIENTVLNGGELIYKTVETLDKGLLKNNEIFQKFMSDYTSAGTSSEKQACLLYLVAVFAIAVYAAVYLWKIGPRATELTTMDDQTQLYREQFVYNIYQLNK
ncbi:MAG: hypothetical protein J0L86_03510 [Flavobacteriales bacterium]|nr:hypothetical protein [Flavobacteriales bacterium]